MDSCTVVMFTALLTLHSRYVDSTADIAQSVCWQHCWHCKVGMLTALLTLHWTIITFVTDFLHAKRSKYLFPYKCCKPAGRTWRRPLKQGQLVVDLCFLYISCALFRCCTLTLPGPRDRIRLVIKLCTSSWVKLTYTVSWRHESALGSSLCNSVLWWARPGRSASFCSYSQ